MDNRPLTWNRPAPARRRGSLNSPFPLLDQRPNCQILAVSLRHLPESSLGKYPMDFELGVEFQNCHGRASISLTPDAPNLINTPLQRGDRCRPKPQNRFNGFLPARETVETVPVGARTSYTPLKGGVNESSARFAFLWARSVWSASAQPRSSSSCSLPSLTLGLGGLDSAISWVFPARETAYSLFFHFPLTIPPAHA